ncbi:MAG: DUF192 domain-containing protein [Pseudomonadota bacterium]
MNKLLFLTGLLTFFVLAPVGGAAQTPQTLSTEDIWIETESGARHHFIAEMAVEPAEQRMGLMHRRDMPADVGMLFLFESAAPRSFWTMNTLMSLDMVFIGEDGTIINIAERTRPFDPSRGPDTHSSTGPALAVLEINGGVSDLLGIEAGDRVVHPHFDRTAN